MQTFHETPKKEHDKKGAKIIMSLLRAFHSRTKIKPLSSVARYGLLNQSTPRYALATPLHLGRSNRLVANELFRCDPQAFILINIGSGYFS